MTLPEYQQVNIHKDIIKALLADSSIPPHVGGIQGKVNDVLWRLYFGTDNPPPLDEVAADTT